MAKICIIGFGCVGSGTYEILNKNKVSISRRAGESIDVKYIVDIRDFSQRDDAYLFTSDYNKVLEDKEICVVVETMGGVGPAYEYTKAALAKGISVVTSNKELVAIKGDELFEIAKQNGAKYLYEASVGGGIPIIRPMVTSLSPNRIDNICGILNGTTNYILTKMFKEGVDFADALSTAQELGYAERNPSADVDGHDTCKKISILSSMVIGKKVNHENVHTEGITKITLNDTKYAEELGYAIKLIGKFNKTEDGNEVFVAPMLINKSNPLAGVEDVFNGILVTGDMLGEAMFYGRGAGKLPTASAVVADIIEAVKTKDAEFDIPWAQNDENIVKDYSKIVSSFFVRVKSGADVQDKIKAINTKIIKEFDGEIVFITEDYSVSELESKLSEFDVISKYMIF